MHRSKWIAVQPPSSANLVDKARDTKLKKVGIPIPPVETKVDSLLPAYQGVDKVAVVAALNDLFTGQTKAT
jgi:hypothetical protein